MKVKLFKEDLEFLLQGVSEFDIQGESIPSELLVHGLSAFPIGLSPDGKAFIAGACYEQGRVIAVTHESYHERKSLSTFLINAIHWLDKRRNGVIGVSPEYQGACLLLSKAGLQRQLTNFKKSLIVFVCNAYNDAQFKEIQEFVARGGGLLIFGHAWWWARCNPGCNVMTDFPGNRILAKMGLCLLDKTVKAGLYKAPYVFRNDLEVLLEGMSEFDIPDECTPSEIVLHGTLAFPIGVTQGGNVFLAGTYYEQGRVILASHEGHLSCKSLSTFLTNALHWLDKGRNGLVGILPKISAAHHLLKRSGLQCHLTNFKKSLSVFVCTTEDAPCKEIQEFVADGGGLLIGGHAWWWARCNPGCNVETTCPGNRIVGKMGLYLSENTLSAGLHRLSQHSQHALELLLQGISEFDIQGSFVLSEVLVSGPSAFSIGFTPDKRPFLAGAFYGLGRVIVVSHESCLSSESMSTFRINAIHWLDKGRNGVIGVSPELQDVHLLMTMSGFRCEMGDFKPCLSVFVCTSYNDAQCKEIQDFVASGGGLLISGNAWQWAQSNPGGNLMTGCPGNRILGKMGLCLLDKTVASGLYKAPQVKQHEIICTQIYHFQYLLHRFAGHVLHGKQLTDYEQQLLKTLGNNCVKYICMQAHDCALYASVVSLLTDLVMKSEFPKVSPAHPIECAKDRLLVLVGSELAKVCKDPDELLSHIADVNLNLPSVSNARIRISANTADAEEWKSTGLYLSPGMRTHMTVPTDIIGRGWQVQISCQTDDLSEAEVLKRAPVRFPVDKERLQIWNLWGGLIYLIAPPRKLGFENLIITSPSEMIRDLNCPDKVASLWDSIMRSIADLAATAPKFPRKERFVADVQITGLRITGYPIMRCPFSATDLVKPYACGKSDFWGPIHELGHNQQRLPWEFIPHTTDCTCNLWSVYVHEMVLDVNRADAHPQLTMTMRQKRIKKYVTAGRLLEEWNEWTALETYLQLQENFGWNAFKKVFAAYHDMKDTPIDNAGKMNLYAVTFSIAVNRNLSTFFKSWGWPIQPATEERLSCLPEWSDHPMVNY